MTMFLLLLVFVLSPVAAASECCLCDGCVEPAEGLVSADFGSGEIGCGVLHERMLQASLDESDEQCKIHVMAHRDNCCGAAAEVSTNQQLRKLQTGTNNPTCQLCRDNNPPECPGRAIGTLLKLCASAWPHSERYSDAGKFLAKASLRLTGRITSQWCNPLRACFQDWCCSPCPAPTPWTASTPADSPNPPTSFSYQSWDSTQERNDERNDDPLQGVCYNSPTGSPPSPSGGGSGGGGPITDQENESGGGLACFPGDSVVDVLGKGKIFMAHLEIGDRVRTGNDKYSRVYSFAHWDPTVLSTFVSIEAGGETLELSADHMLYVNEKVVRASEVSIGDVLIGEAQRPLIVTKIASAQKRGVYAPATEAGNLMVNGILASIYVALIPGDPTILSQHTLSHMLLSPFRMYCRWDFKQCEMESYTAGISDKYWSLAQIVLTSNTWTPATQFWVSAALLPFVLFLWGVEQVTLGWFSIAIAALGMWAVLRRRTATIKSIH